jgi:hypothetical protein
MTTDVDVVPESMKLLRTIDEESNVYRIDLGERRGNLVRDGSGTTYPRGELLSLGTQKVVSSTRRL